MAALATAEVIPEGLMAVHHLDVAVQAVRPAIVILIAAAIPMVIAVPAAVAATPMVIAVRTAVAVIRMAIVTLVTVPHHMAIRPEQTHLHLIIAM